MKRITAQQLALALYKAVRGVGRLTGVARWRFSNGQKVGARAGRMMRRLVAATGGTAPVMVRGHRMFLPPNCTIAAWLLTDSFEAGTTQQFEARLKEGMTVIDGGAYAGYYTLFAAKCVGPSGRVYAFEPQSDNFALLTKNIELNGYRNVVPVQKALGAANGSATLYLEGTSLHSLYPAASTSAGSERVEVTTLDTFLENEGWPRIDFIKLDLEGGEPAALFGMRRLLERSPQIQLVLELNPASQRRAGADPHAFLRTLQSLGFAVAVIDDHTGLPLEPDGVIAELKDGAVNILCTRRGRQAQPVGTELPEAVVGSAAQ